MSLVRMTGGGRDGERSVFQRGVEIMVGHWRDVDHSERGLAAAYHALGIFDVDIVFT